MEVQYGTEPFQGGKKSNHQADYHFTWNSSINILGYQSDIITGGLIETMTGHDTYSVHVKTAQLYEVDLFGHPSLYTSSSI